MFGIICFKIQHKNPFCFWTRNAWIWSLHVRRLVSHIHCLNTYARLKYITAIIYIIFISVSDDLCVMEVSEWVNGLVSEWLWMVSRKWANKERKKKKMENGTRMQQHYNTRSLMIIIMSFNFIQFHSLKWVILFISL